MKEQKRKRSLAWLVITAVISIISACSLPDNSQGGGLAGVDPPYLLIDSVNNLTSSSMDFVIRVTDPSQLKIVSFQVKLENPDVQPKNFSRIYNTDVDFTKQPKGYFYGKVSANGLAANTKYTATATLAFTRDGQNGETRVSESVTVITNP